MDNQIHFEQTPYHHVYLKDRKTLELTGIKKIESFDRGTNSWKLSFQEKFDKIEVSV